MSISRPFDLNVRTDLLPNLFVPSLVMLDCHDGLCLSAPESGRIATTKFENALVRPVNLSDVL
jgi:hypothetical protein